MDTSPLCPECGSTFAPTDVPGLATCTGCGLELTAGQLASLPRP